MQNKKGAKRNIYIVIAILLLLITGGAASYMTYHVVLEPNLTIKEPTYFYIPTGSEFKDVERLLAENHLIKNINTFTWLANKKNIPPAFVPDATC